MSNQAVFCYCSGTYVREDKCNGNKPICKAHEHWRQGMNSKIHKEDKK